MFHLLTRCTVIHNAIWPTRFYLKCRFLLKPKLAKVVQETWTWAILHPRSRTRVLWHFDVFNYNCLKNNSTLRCLLSFSLQVLNISILTAPFALLALHCPKSKRLNVFINSPYYSQQATYIRTEISHDLFIFNRLNKLSFMNRISSF